MTTMKKASGRGCQISFLNFMDSVIRRLDRLGRIGTCRNYLTTLNSFRKFRSGKDITFPEFTAELVEDYEAWLNGRRLKPNSVSFYLRILRAVYRRAVDQGLTTDSHPFAKVNTRIGKTVKRAIPLADIRSIKRLDLTRRPALEFARDVFLFLFYCRGMSFIDAAYLRHSDIRGNQIEYRRHKTGQLLSVGLNGHIRAIIDHYHTPASPFLLPILPPTVTDSRMAYESAMRRINNSLKKVAVLASVRTNLTTYVSRHSWASIAKSKGIPTGIISDALGHDSEQTTQIYLASISDETINRANDLILEDL